MDHAKIETRIQPGEAADFVQLDGPEMDLYRGCGPVLAAVDGPRVVEMLYIDAIETARRDVNTTRDVEIKAGEVAKAAMQWAHEQIAAGRRVVHAMASCSTLCDLREWDDMLVAKIAREQAEIMIDLYFGE